MSRVWVVALALAGSAPAGAPKWTAILQPTGTSVLTGTAVVEEIRSDSLEAEIQLSGAKPGTEIAWHIHLGGCDDRGMILGPQSAYPLLKAGAEGKATGGVTLAGAMPSQGEYSITVHKSNTDLTAVACGGLKSVLSALPETTASPQ